MSKVTDLVEELARPILDDMELELVDIEYVKEGKNWFLRLFIDKENGVDIEECGLVSERLSAQLDEIDPIPHNYFLEVSSPGAERPLKKEKDFMKAIGKMVHINLSMNRWMVISPLKVVSLPLIIKCSHLK